MKIPLVVLAVVSTIMTTWAQPAGTAPEVGKAAPEFTLMDTAGKEVKLSDYKGKYVVLEWVNLNCPFVRKFYETQTMQKLQKEFTGKGVVWLSICSTARTHQDYHDPADTTTRLKKLDYAGTAYLLDADGKVGGLYQARTTPDMFVINPKGVLIYKGAIDDQPTPDHAAVADAKNYVATALGEAMAGKPVADSNTKSYGCSVKYQ